MALVTSNARTSSVAPGTDTVYVTASGMRVMELLAIGNCIATFEGTEVTLRPEGMQSISLTTPTAVLDQLIVRGLVERAYDFVQLAHGTWIA